jgi:lipopolysaccharide transport system ATP-binding protein
MSRPVISVENLSKSYRLGLRAQRDRSFRDLLTDVARAPMKWARGSARGAPSAEEFWALKDVSFTVQAGEVIGIIGRNGAGKSTLLKVLSRITEPTEGLVRYRGRMASLLEVGTGFHLDLTGRENIYLNGSILGMRRREIDRNFDQIVAFAEVERFLDTAVKHYSTGMYVRLAFAVAAHLDPDILIVDEVLAVGDAEFQKKCLGRIKEVTNEGRTVLFVSHNAPAVQNLCTRCLYMQRGRLVMEGEPAAVLEAYSLSTGGDTSLDVDLTDHAGRASSAKPYLRRVRVRGSGSNENFISIGDDLEFEISYETRDPLSDPALWILIKNHLGMNLFGAAPDVNPTRRSGGRSNVGKFTCRIPKIPLIPGVYGVDLNFGSPHSMQLDAIQNACQFEVHPTDIFGTGKLPWPIFGSICWPASWDVTSGEAAADLARLSVGLR